MPMNTENYKIVNVEGTTSKFKASIKVGFKNEEDYWLHKKLRYKKRICVIWARDELCCMHLCFFPILEKVLFSSGHTILIQ